MKTRLGSGLLAVVLLSSLAPSTGNAAPTTALAGVKPQAAKGFEATLITGDRVRVAATGAVSLAQGKGREHIRFLTTRASGHVRVVPTDALPLLRAGRLDPRLFDVTTLAAFGYDNRSELPLIVTGTGDARAALSAGGAKVVRDLPAVNGLAVRAPRDGTLWTALKNDARIGKVWLDGVRQPVRDDSALQAAIDAPQAAVSKACAGGSCAESSILAAMQSAAENGAKAVSLGVGGSDTAETDLIEQAVQTLTGKHGTLFVTASGNADAALTVGAVNSAVGAAAALAQRRPDLTAAQLKSILVGSAAPDSGHVDAARAAEQTVFAATSNVSFGRQAWPHGDDVPVAKTVTYQNIGASAVTLQLAATATGPDGNPTPAGAFTLSATTLTVPAGGTAAVTLTADTRVAFPDGLAQGRLVATAGASTVQTPFTIEKEVESYDVTLTQIDRAGQSPDEHQTLVVRTDEPGFYDMIATEPTATVRLPRGAYTLHTMQVDFLDPAAPPQLNFAVRPGLALTANQNITVDARLSKPFDITVERSNLPEVYGHASATTATPEGLVSIGIAGHELHSVQSLALGPQTPVDGFHMQVATTRAHTNAAGSPTNSPVVYNLAWITKGQMVTGATHHVLQRDLATVIAHYAAPDEGGIGEVSTWAIAPGPFDFPAARDLVFNLPFTRTEYYNTDVGGQWLSLLLEVDGDDVAQSSVQQQPRVYRVGRTYHERWNRAVFGPAVGQPVEPALVSTRTGNEIHAWVPSHGDGAGRAGLANFASARTALFKDGVLVGEVDDVRGDFTVPADRGRYRLEVDVQRTPGPSLSTRVSGVWTFRSGHTDGTATLPLWTVTFSPEVNERNTAPAGRAFAIPVKAVAAPGSPAGRLSSLRVEVSFDGGATWRPAWIANGAARVIHPSGSGYVSLRAVARDSRDNAVEQTIINAYRFG